MDFREVCQFLGGSPLADEYRGDFQQIAASIAHEENLSQPLQTLELKAASSLRKAAFCTLSGNINAAQAALDSLALFRLCASRKMGYSSQMLSEFQPPASTESSSDSVSVRLRKLFLNHPRRQIGPLSPCPAAASQ